MAHHKICVPNIDDFIMQILGMSIALKPNGVIGRSTYDIYKPEEWPTLRCVLEHYDTEPTKAGWRQFVDTHIGQFDHVVVKARWCKVCGNPRLHKTRRCYTCYGFWLRNGHDRPRHLWDVDAKCSNCNFPLSAVGVKVQRDGIERRRQCNGRCQTCDSYWRKYKRERPKYLWGDGPHGFCECGYPAVALVEDIPVCVRHQE
jgi:hypothetical protein